MSKSGEAHANLTYDEIRSMTLKEVGEWLEHHQKTDHLNRLVVEHLIEALKCGVMPK